MAQIREHLNSTNQKINSYDKMRKTIVNLGSKKGERQQQLISPTNTSTELITNDHC